MTHITNQDLVKLSRISQIAVHEDQLTSMRHEVEGVLNYASSLYDIAQQGQVMAPLSKNVNVMRADEIKPSNAEVILASAPEREEPYFVVPKIIKQ